MAKLDNRIIEYETQHKCLICFKQFRLKFTNANDLEEFLFIEGLDWCCSDTCREEEKRLFINATFVGERLLSLLRSKQ